MSDDEGRPTAAERQLIDVQFWSSLPHWTPTEFEWLVLGIDPDWVLEDGFDQRPFESCRATIRARFDRLVDQEERYLSPSHALEVAEKIGKTFPPKLCEAIRLRAATSPEREKSSAPIRSQDITALKRKVSSLQKIMIAIAAKTYGWNPHRDPPALLVNDISDAFESLGMKMDRNTIRGHLNKAKESLTAGEESAIVSALQED
jgi:hypothetical protein